MRVILLKDTPKVGNKDDIVEVKNGYAMNYLIPNRFAVKATPELEKKVKERKEAEKKSKEEKVKALQSDLEELSRETIRIEVKANEKGHLFAGIGKKEIISAIKEKFGKEINEKAIELHEEIKEVGEREIKASAGEKNFKLKIAIEGA